MNKETNIKKIGDIGIDAHYVPTHNWYLTLLELDGK